MAPLPFNNTSILFVDYHTCQEDHTLQCRFGAGSDVGSAMTAVDTFLTNLAGAVRALDIIGARLQLVGENVSNDVAWTGAASYGSGGGSHFESAQYFNFIGRSSAGRRVRVSCFGAGVEELGTDFRASTGETSSVDDNVAFLNSLTDEFVAIDGTHPTWKAYANMGPNAHWRNKIR